MRKSEAVPAEIVAAVASARTFLVTGHKNPDGDAIGSALAMAGLLHRLQREVYIFFEDGLPEIYSFLPRSSEIRNRLEGKYDVAIVLDSGTPLRVSEKLDMNDFAALVINIDHHPVQRPFGDYSYIDTGAAAVGEQIFHLASALGISLDREIAECLYVSILTDTGGFRYSNTTSETHRIAADLIDYGLAPAMISSRVYERRTPEQLRLLSEVIERMHVDGELAWAVVDRRIMEELGLRDSDLDGTIDLLRSVDGVRVAAIFSERPDGRVKGSLRSKGGFNVLSVAHELGGGGHRAASGFVSNDSIDMVAARTVKLLRERLESGHS